ncbi:MAG: hypothetical protein EZS28_005193 [Streblomastix strix]|uniref:Uncharacterized protein n=1 Tax=Streblomastix strix TaxID=222440 RepID=A0A5J4WY84_9EUKA|nr:MAG: hypothetical protein EZS28_005193 [Streblomastix strix]
MLGQNIGRSGIKLLAENLVLQNHVSKSIYFIDDERFDNQFDPFSFIPSYKSKAPANQAYKFGDNINFLAYQLICSATAYSLTTSAINQPQKPVLPTAAQISVHSLVVKAGSEHIIRTGKVFMLLIIYCMVYYQTSIGWSSNVVITPAELIFILLPNKQRTDNAFDANGSIEVIKLFVVGQYKRINPIARYATLVLQSIIQQ